MITRFKCGNEEKERRCKEYYRDWDDMTGEEYTWTSQREADNQAKSFEVI